MQSLSKFNLNGGLKRIVSTLICVMMVLATFPMHMLKNTVSAAGGDPINLTLGDEKDEGATVGNGSEVSNWMNGQLADLTGKGDINITLSNNITVTSEVTAESLPIMTTGEGKKYFFDFTDGRFAGKTITIDGQDKTIKIDNAGLFFLNLKNCTVILKNITIDGGWLGMNEDGTDVTGGIKRDGSFIYVNKPDSGKSSELEIEKGTTIQNCKNTQGSGGAIGSSGQLTINGGSITNCISSSSGSCYGGAICSYFGNVTINGGSITNCIASSSGSAYGGAIYLSGGTITMNSGSISDCCCSGAGGAYGGAINFDGGTMTINSGSITNCSVAGGNNSWGDAICSEAILYLPSTDSGFLTIKLPVDHANPCTHNSSLEAPLDYVGICNNGGTVEPNPNRKIEFFDSESKPLDGFAFGTTNDEISVPDSVPNRPGYKFALSYINNNNNNEKTSIEGVSDDGKFTLTQGMLDTAANGVIKVYVNYDKLYTEQYFNHSEFVGIIRAKRA